VRHAQKRRKGFMDNKNVSPIDKSNISKQIHYIAHRDDVSVRFVLSLKEHADIELNDSLKKFKAVSDRIKKNLPKFKNNEKRLEVKSVSLSGDPSTDKVLDLLKKEFYKSANIYQGVYAILDNPDFFSDKKLIVLGSPFNFSFLTSGEETDDLLYICIEMSKGEDNSRVLSMRHICQSNWNSSEYEFLVVSLI
jgi:hypothetical protein